MRLWLLRPVDPDAQGGPWDPWYDKTFGFVVRAETEEDARTFAATEAGDEVREHKTFALRALNPWLDPTLVSCVELTPDGPAAIVMQDHHAA